MNESLNTEYKQNARKTEKVLHKKTSPIPYRWSTIEYNTINTGTSEIFCKAIVASKCGPQARTEKQGYVIKT